MIPHFSAVSTPPTTASMHQQSLMYTNQNQTGIQGAHQQPQPFVYQPQEGIPFQVLIFVLTWVAFGNRLQHKTIRNPTLFLSYNHIILASANTFHFGEYY